MWPMLLDYTKDESKRILRRLELEAYASIISVFRAQGDLNKDKKKILQDLQQTLSISTERHRAEVRRAINDEKLATIADNIAGTASTSEWLIEGRRLVPLMPRLVPQTSFTAAANHAASAMMEKNSSLPLPSQTWNKDGPTSSLPKPSRSSSPTSNVVVLPSGTSMQIKGMLNQDEDEDLYVNMLSRRGQRSMSSDSQNASSVSTQTPRITYTTASSTMAGSSPVKITISKSPQGRPITIQSSSQPPKVFLVTSAGPASGSTVIHRSLSVPVVHTPPTTLSTNSGSGPPRSSVVIPGGHPNSASHMAPAFSGVVTSSSNTSLVPSSVSIPSTSSSQAMFSPSVQIGFGKVRPRLVPRQRYQAFIPHPKQGMVIPAGPQLMSPSVITSGSQITQSQFQHTSTGIQVSPSQQGTSSIQVKALSKPTIQIKQEGGMKIITQSNTSKILPKPSQISSNGAPVVMVNTGQSTSGSTSGVTLLPRSSYTAHSGSKVLNITTPGGRVIATTTKATNVVTVNPKTLHLTAVKSGSGSTTVSKPNVIVVQKTQHTRFQGPLVQGGTNIRTITTSALPGTIDKELMGLVQKDSQGRHVLTASNPSISTNNTGRVGERRVIITTSGGSGEIKQPVSIIHRAHSEGEGKTSLLAQAAGIVPPDGIVETAAQGTDPYDFDNPDNITQTGAAAVPLVASCIASAYQSQQQISRFPLQWQSQLEPGDSSAEEEPNGYGKRSEERRESQDSDIVTDQVFTLEQAMSLLSKENEQLSSSTNMTPFISQFLSQPKQVSILAASKPFLTETNRETVATGQHSENIFGEVVISPEEGLKEGQLDTHTGLFCQVQAVEKYCSSSKSSKDSKDKAWMTSSVPIALVQPGQGSSTSLPSTHPPLDLLSSSLAEAQINLNSFNDDGEEDYDEEGDVEDEVNQDETHTQLPVSTVDHISGESAINSRSGMAEVLMEETAKDGTRILTVSNPSHSQESVVANNLLVSLPSHLSRASLPSTVQAPSLSPPASTYVTVQELTCPLERKTSNSMMSKGQLTPSQKSSPYSGQALPIAVSIDQSSIITLKLDEPMGKTRQEQEQLQNGTDTELATDTGAKSVESEVNDSVASPNEPAASHDDFGTGGSDMDSQSDGIISSEQLGLVRSSKRKRKHPSGLDEPFQAAPGSWVKVAASLLLKVARFKGSPRDKNEIPAAEWFTYPVDPLDAPDYYSVIQNPMDFSTMRKKLETGQYCSFEDFQLDMELIKTNCYLYNREDTKVRSDCDEVMVFYKSELAKLQEKQLNKAFMQNASPVKRQKFEEK